MGSFGPTELLIILVIVVVLFGASRLAGIGGAVGNSIREFRRAVREDEKAAQANVRDEEARESARH